MGEEKKHSICTVEDAPSLDSWWRKLLQNPKRILSPFVQDGMHVLDFGCGPGLFAVELAKMVGPKGKVVAADLQQEMLDRVKAKIAGTGFEPRVSLHRTSANSTGLKEKFDFVLAFYAAHETPSVEKFLKEMRSLLKPGGTLLVVEPSFHVSKQEFQETLKAAEKAGLKEIKRPRVLLSRAALFQDSLK
jgi:ubiquinone/menaquinone biosynthesis C-methylase UbiE